jgi:hypothetical protein
MHNFLDSVVKKSLLRKEIWWSLFIVFIMVFSAFGVIFYGFASPSNKLRYGEYKFSVVQGGFAVTINNKNYVFQHFPGDLSSINVTSDIIEMLKNTKMLYLTYNQNQSMVGEIAATEFQFQSDLQNVGIFGATALTTPNEYGLPTINCDNATRFVPVIDFREANETAINSQGNCIILNAAYGEDFSRMTDRLLLGMLGVMK